MVEIPFQTIESIRLEKKSNRTTDAKNTADDLPVFYCILISSQLTFDTSINTSEVINKLNKLYLYLASLNALAKWQYC